MYAFLIDDNKRIISYQPTTYEFVKTEAARPEMPPHPKPGIDYVEYWDEAERKLF